MAIEALDFHCDPFTGSQRGVESMHVIVVGVQFATNNVHGIRGKILRGRHRERIPAHSQKIGNIKYRMTHGNRS